MRKTLPNRRRNETFKMQLMDQNRSYHVTVGLYDDGSFGEVFINGGKAGTDMLALARDGAILISLGLQHGVELKTMSDAITRNEDGKPSTVVGAVLDELQRRSGGD